MNRPSPRHRARRSVNPEGGSCLPVVGGLAALLIAVELSVFPGGLGGAPGARLHGAVALGNLARYPHRLWPRLPGDCWSLCGGSHDHVSAFTSNHAAGARWHRDALVPARRQPESARAAAQTGGRAGVGGRRSDGANPAYAGARQHQRKDEQYRHLAARLDGRPCWLGSALALPHRNLPRQCDVASAAVVPFSQW